MDKVEEYTSSPFAIRRPLLARSPPLGRAGSMPHLRWQEAQEQRATSASNNKVCQDRPANNENHPDDTEKRLMAAIEAASKELQAYRLQRKGEQEISAYETDEEELQNETYVDDGFSLVKSKKRKRELCGSSPVKEKERAQPVRIDGGRRARPPPVFVNYTLADGEKIRNGIRAKMHEMRRSTSH